jgi:hypothetical protein
MKKVISMRGYNKKMVSKADLSIVDEIFEFFELNYPLFNRGLNTMAVANKKMEWITGVSGYKNGVIRMSLNCAIENYVQFPPDINQFIELCNANAPLEIKEIKNLEPKNTPKNFMAFRAAMLDLGLKTN